MRQTFSLAALLALAVGAEAQQKFRAPPTQPPPGKVKVGDDATPQGEVRLLPAPGSNRAERKLTFAPPPVVPGWPPLFNRPVAPVYRAYSLGIYGYDSGEGFVLLNAGPVKDYAVGRLRSPVSECLVDVTGAGNFIPGHLDRGDRIVSIDGYLVSSPGQVVAAVQGAANDPVLDLVVVDFRTQRPYRAKVRPALVVPVTLQTGRP